MDLNLPRIAPEKILVSPQYFKQNYRHTIDMGQTGFTNKSYRYKPNKDK